MEAEVLNFLTRLATEPELYSAWLRDPQAMKLHGLDDKSKRRCAAATPAGASGNQRRGGGRREGRRGIDGTCEAGFRHPELDPRVALWLQNHYYQC